MAFASLHNHSQYSLLDSTNKIENMIKRAKELNYSAIALTDHGVMYGFVDWEKEGQKQGIKVIHGVEVYECDSFEEKEGRFHLVLLAKNNKGLQSLHEIMKISHVDGFYGKPRITLEHLKPYAHNLIALSACMAGRISRIIVNDYQKAKEYILKYKSIFSNDFYIEMQSHSEQTQLKLNKLLLQIAKETNTPWIITHDSHYTYKEDVDAHSIFVEIGQEREVGETYQDCYLQSESETKKIMLQCISNEDIEIAFENTVKIAEKCNTFINFNKPYEMPVIKIPKQYKNSEAYYLHLLKEGWEKKKHTFIGDIEVYKKRVRDEYKVLKELGYLDYFLMLRQITDLAKSKQIPIGYSRGSGANCLHLYLLGVTAIDSIRWGLDFSRFANLGRRGSPADYDLDCSKARRKELIQLIKNDFGEEQVTPLATFNTLARKVAIRDIGKVLDSRGIYQIPYQERDEIAKIISTDVDIEEAVEHNIVLQNYAKKYPLLFKYTKMLEGLPKSKGQHAAALLITQGKITNYMGVCLNKDKEPQAMLEMYNAMDDLKLQKMDVLG